VRLNGVVAEIDDATGLAKEIETVCVYENEGKEGDK